MATYNIGGFPPYRRALRRFAQRVFFKLFYLLDRRPGVGRVLTSFLRLKPVWRIGQTVLVTGDRQVAEVLNRDDDFPLPDKRPEKFLTGAFVLGMSRTPQFVLERRELETVVDENDRPRLEKLADASSQAAVSPAKSVGTLDVVSGLCTPVGLAILRDYFGVSNADTKLLDDLRLLGAMIASPHSELEDFREQAEAAASRVHDVIRKEIGGVQARLAGQTSLSGGATVLERLVFRSQTGESNFDPEDVRRNITGVLLPGSALVARAFATALVQLFKREELRTAAYAAAGQGDLKTLEGCLIEALRFHPVFPIVPRYCPRETTLPGFKQQYKIKTGRSVFAAVSLAMFDPHAKLFDEPGGGRPADVRIRDREQYRHFGGGAHECLGKHIALPQMAAMMYHLLQLPELKVGRIRYQDDDGISPESLLVRFRRQTPPSDERRGHA